MKVVTCFIAKHVHLMSLQYNIEIGKLNWLLNIESANLLIMQICGCIDYQLDTTIGSFHHPYSNTYCK